MLTGRLFANSVDPDETAHNEPSHQDLRFLTFSLSTSHINFFSIDSLLKIIAVDKCSLKFGTERVKGSVFLRNKQFFLSKKKKKKKKKEKTKGLIN